MGLLQVAANRAETMSMVVNQSGRLTVLWRVKYDGLVVGFGLGGI